MFLEHQHHTGQVAFGLWLSIAPQSSWISSVVKSEKFSVVGHGGERWEGSPDLQAITLTKSSSPLQPPFSKTEASQMQSKGTRETMLGM